MQDLSDFAPPYSVARDPLRRVPYTTNFLEATFGGVGGCTSTVRAFIVNVPRFAICARITEHALAIRHEVVPCAIVREGGCSFGTGSASRRSVIGGFVQ